jgi:hypothetical protein
MCSIANLSGTLGEDPAPGLFKHYTISYECA